MASPFAPKQPIPQPTPLKRPFNPADGVDFTGPTRTLQRIKPRPPAASPPQLTQTLASFARVAVLWALLGLGLAGGGAAFVWLVTSPDDIDQKILTLTGRGRP
jgi:hypothetical protein